MQVIDQINGSALFAQSAYSASISTKDSLGRDITATYLTGIDLSNYYTKDETSGKEELANAFANIPVGDPEVNAYVTSNSASIDESTNLVQVNSSTWNDVTAYQSNSANYITAHQSLEGLMSASLLESADGKWTAYNSIPFKAGDEFPASADEAIQAYQTNSSTYLTAHQSLDGLMSANLLEFNAENHISSYNGSAFEDSSPTLPMTGRDGVDVQMDNGTLVLSSTLYETVTTNSAQWNQKLDSDVFTAWSANQAANDYQLSAGIGVSIVDDDINKITRIDVTAGGGTGGDMFTSYLEYNDQNQISGYAGSAFAGQGGGGEVPTGTMNVSGLEYNAVNEISAYNGSAIAQYGAEKQWLVHDDTLVHASNSAQYALGVNVSALQRLMGIDKTVLWNGRITAAGTTAQLSEPLTAFDKLEFVLQLDNLGNKVETYLASGQTYSFYYSYPFQGTFRNDMAWLQFNEDYKTWQFISANHRAWNTAGNFTENENNWQWTFYTLKEIRGIGRKEV